MEGRKEKKKKINKGGGRQLEKEAGERRRWEVKGKDLRGGEEKKGPSDNATLV